MDNNGNTSCIACCLLLDDYNVTSNGGGSSKEYTKTLGGDHFKVLEDLVQAYGIYMAAALGLLRQFIWHDQILLG